MRRNNRMIVPALITALAIFMGSGRAFCQGKLSQVIEIELKRLEETYNLLDTFGEKIWPGWSNHMDIEYQVQFPNLVFLLVNPRGDVPAEYTLLENRTVRGRTIYLDRTKELPVDLKPPLHGGGGGGLTIRIRLSENTKPVDLAVLSDEEKGSESSENQILLVIHEYFHGFQAKFRPERPKPPKKPVLTEEEQAKRRKEMKKLRIPVFLPTADYAVYKEIAGQALFNAYNEKSNRKARKYLEDYCVARERQLATMSETFAADEKRTQMMEGTAVYAELRMAQMAHKKGYRPSISKADDPFFFDYKYVDGYLKSKMEDSVKTNMNATLDTLVHSYTYGMYQGFLLDRFVKKWKKDFFVKNKTMDDIMGAYLKLDEKKKARIAGGFAARYGLDKLYAKHGPVIKERDDAIALIQSRKGRTYIVDFEATKEFIRTTPRGKSASISVREIFPHGIEKLTLGDVEMTGRDIPMEREWLYTVQWVDTEAKEGEKGYTLVFGAKDGDIYKNAVLTTNGFTLKAPEIRITEEEGNAVRIEVLSKVAR